jgi:Domain of unknown function (DUF1998)
MIFKFQSQCLNPLNLSHSISTQSLMKSASSKFKVGELRPSQILFSAGIGSVIDLPNLSTMVMGLDDWDSAQADELGEPRLLTAVQSALNRSVKALKSPPIAPDTNGPSSDQTSNIGIPVAPFPLWMRCPQCNRIASLHSGLFELKKNLYHPDRNFYVHSSCQSNRRKSAPKVLPVRFLVACKKGHLDDFPWHYFVHRGSQSCENSALQLREYGVSGSAADIEVKCLTCDAKRRMSDAFGEQGKINMPQCRGRNAHLRNFEADGCDEQMIAISLGASNSWFPITLSALSIPTMTDPLGQLVEKHWVTLEKATSLEVVTAFRAIGNLKEFTQYSDVELWKAIQKMSDGNQDEEIDSQDLKTPEWNVFSNVNTSLNSSDFQLKQEVLPQGYEPYFEQVVLVEKLREVRALISFTRIESPGDFADTGEIPKAHSAPLSRKSPTWVPAAEVRGEGIFIQFREEAIVQWQNKTPIQEYNKDCFNAHQTWRKARNLDNPHLYYPEARYILIHSFAHALMRQLSIECGYTAASLRERIYSRSDKDKDGPMAGLLIYTAAPDSEGTLGGLVKLGKPENLGRHIEQALEQIRICASDPLCADHTFQKNPAIALHGAACHACLFSPETSCERGNKYLDRNVLISTVQSEKSELAFFKHLT